MIEIIYILIAVGYFIGDIVNEDNNIENELITSVIVSVLWPIILGVKLQKSIGIDNDTK